MNRTGKWGKGKERERSHNQGLEGGGVMLKETKVAEKKDGQPYR